MEMLGRMSNEHFCGNPIRHKQIEFFKTNQAMLEHHVKCLKIALVIDVCVARFLSIIHLNKIY